MAKAAATAHSHRNKAEVQQEFLKIREEAAATREGRNAKVEEADKLREAEVRQAVDGLSVEGVAQSISALSVQISKALAEVSDNLISEVRRLATIREAVALEREELQRLHKIDIAATALDQLVQEYDSKKRESGAEISAERAAWDAEVKARERAEKEYDENLKKQRQRETDEYEYKKTLDRKKTQDKYDEEMRALEKKNREKQEALEKDWQGRDRAIKEREEDYLRLQQEVGSFSSRLQAEVERARSEAIQQTEQRFEQQSLLMTKEREADRRFAELQVKTLEEAVARQTAQIAALQKQLDEAKQQVQDIAVKAIEGASGARALTHVNQIAMEQAKTRAGQV
jgi:colicin import membrane protein